MNTRTRKALSFALAFFFISSAALSPVLGPASLTSSASAKLDYEECAADVVTSSVFENVIDYFLDRPNHCLGTGGSDYVNMTRAELDSDAHFTQERNDNHLVSVENRFQDTDGVAMMKAKIAIVNSLNSGDNETVAKQEAKDAVTEYYTTIQLNLINQWGTNPVQYRKIARSENANTGANKTWIRMRDNGVEWVNGTKIFYDYNNTVTLTLYNGTNVTADGIVYDQGSFGMYVSHPAYPAADMYTTTSLNKGNMANTTNVTFNDSNGVKTNFAEYGRYDDAFIALDDEHTQMKANVDTMVTDIYTAYNAGEIDTTDVMDPVTLASQAGTDSDSTGYYKYAAAQMAALGYNGSMNHSHVVSYNNTTYTGTIYYTGDDISALETGKNYTPSKWAGSFILAYSGNESKNESAQMMELTDTFKITEATNTKTGEAVNKTVIEKHVYKTTDVSDLKHQFGQLQELLEEYRGTQAPASGGGLSDGQMLGLGAAAAAAAALSMGAGAGGSGGAGGGFRKGRY